MTYSDFLCEWRSDSDVIVAHTSGSTGSPKAITLDKSFVRRSAQRTIDYFSLTADSRLHSCIAADFIGGKMMAVRAEMLGASFTWEEPSMKPLEGVVGDFDLVAVVPAQMKHVVENAESYRGVKRWLVGGAPVDDHLRRKICEAEISAYETYGMTETASHIALRRIAVPQPGFAPLPGISLRQDGDGALIITLDGCNEVVTNDICKISDDGTFEIVGRRDNVIVTGGKKVSAEWIERQLQPRVDDIPFYVTWVADERWSQRIVLVAACVDSVYNLDLLRDAVRSIEEHWKRPKEIYLVETLPSTASGKLLRLRPDDPRFDGFGKKIYVI